MAHRADGGRPRPDPDRTPRLREARRSRPDRGALRSGLPRGRLACRGRSAHDRAGEHRPGRHPHARHKRLEDVVARFAAELGLAADSPSALLYELNRRGRDAPPIVAVLDALDEAGSGTAADTGGRGEPRRIARDLLRPLSEIPGIRLLIGTRKELISSLGTGFEVLDLDAAQYADDEDLAGYVAAVLLAADEPDVKTPYRGRDELASRSGGRWRSVPPGLPGGPDGAACGRPLNRWTPACPAGWTGCRARSARPSTTTCPGSGRTRSGSADCSRPGARGGPGPAARRGVAGAGERTVRDRDDGRRPRLVLTAANSYVAEVTEHGRSVYRLYHQSLAEHLAAIRRWTRRGPEPHRRRPHLTGTAVSRRADGRGRPAPRLVRRPAVRPGQPGDARGGRRPDRRTRRRTRLPAGLGTVAAAARTDDGALRGGQAHPQRLRAGGHQVLDTRALGERAAYLQLSARRCGAGELADRIDRLELDLPWSTRWAWYSPTGVHRQLPTRAASTPCPSANSTAARSR